MEYGISILGIVPLRAEAKDQSEIISQVLALVTDRTIDSMRNTCGMSSGKG